MISRIGLSTTLSRDITAGLVVSLVALPLCLGVALASNAPLLSGVVAGIVGGVLVGLISRSSKSVSGPAAGLTAVVAAQIATLGSFEAFLLAVVVAGLIQIALGVARAGFIAAFVPSGVIKGLLAAIGIILILKQIPHVLGHDLDPQGDMAFLQPNQSNTFREFGRIFEDIHPGPAAIGLISLALLVLWGRWKPLKRSNVPAPLVVVLLGVALNLVFRSLGGRWAIEPVHLVQVPVTSNFAGLTRALSSPDFSQWLNPAVYVSGVTIAAVASLEALLNLEAAEKIDPERGHASPSRELVAQGIGNVVTGLVGGLPITTVIVRSSLNINAGARTKVAAITHGSMLLISVALFPAVLNLIPLSCLAAILLITGVKLASPKLVTRAWREGFDRFVPFAVTVLSIVLTDLVSGLLIGMVTSVGFILWSNVRQPLRQVVEKHMGGEVIHIELANQVSFLNRAALDRTLNEIPPGGHVLLDARNTDYIDPDVLSMIRDFKEYSAPAHGVEVSLLGFLDRYQLEDQTQYLEHSTREFQSAITPQEVLEILKEGHGRFLSGQRLTRNLGRQVRATASGQHPLAAVLSCIDSRTPAELIFDLGMGDIFSVRIAGNITSRKVLGSIEYACAVAGAKLILVMGHTRCGAVNAAVNLLDSPEAPSEATGCQNIDPIVYEIQQAVDRADGLDLDQLAPEAKESYINGVARRNILRVVDSLPRQSQTLAHLVEEGRIAIVGAMYDVVTGDLEFLPAPEDASHETRVFT